MGKMKKNLLADLMISSEDRSRVERSVRREIEIESGMFPIPTKVHKSQKAYSRKIKYKHLQFEY